VHGEAVARLRQAGWEAVPAPRKILTDGVAIAAALVPRCQDARDVMTRSNLAFRLRAEETEAWAGAGIPENEEGAEGTSATPELAP
jgi:hypothetical protein